MQTQNSPSSGAKRDEVPALVLSPDVQGRRMKPGKVVNNSSSVLILPPETDQDQDQLSSAFEVRVETSYISSCPRIV